MLPTLSASEEIAVQSDTPVSYTHLDVYKRQMYKSVVAELQKIPEIVECHFTTGPYTMLTKLYACDNEQDVYKRQLQYIAFLYHLFD